MNPTDFKTWNCILKCEACWDFFLLLSNIVFESQCMPLSSRDLAKAGTVNLDIY